MRGAVPSPAALILVSLGGAAGAVLRWAADGLAPAPGGFPWVTFAINLIGSFALALLPALTRRPGLVLFFGPGLLGGFTTLSACAEESRWLLAGGRPFLALAYLLGTLGACLAGVRVASRLASRLHDGEGRR